VDVAQCDYGALKLRFFVTFAKRQLAVPPDAHSRLPTRPSLTHYHNNPHFALSKVTRLLTLRISCTRRVTPETSVPPSVTPVATRSRSYPAKRWQKVLNAVNCGDMPPEADFLDDLAKVIVVARRNLSDSRGVITMRRLNQRGYGGYFCKTSTHARQEAPGPLTVCVRKNNWIHEETTGTRVTISVTFHPNQ